MTAAKLCAKEMLDECKAQNSEPDPLLYNLHNLASSSSEMIDLSLVNDLQSSNIEFRNKLKQKLDTLPTVDLPRKVKKRGNNKLRDITPPPPPPPNKVSNVNNTPPLQPNQSPSLNNYPLPFNIPLSAIVANPSLLQPQLQSNYLYYISALQAQNNMVNLSPINNDGNTEHPEDLPELQLTPNNKKLMKTNSNETKEEVEDGEEEEEEDYEKEESEMSDMSEEHHKRRKLGLTISIKPEDKSEVPPQQQNMQQNTQINTNPSSIQRPLPLLPTPLRSPWGDYSFGFSPSHILTPSQFSTTPNVLLSAVNNPNTIGSNSLKTTFDFNEVFPSPHEESAQHD